MTQANEFDEFGWDPKRKMQRKRVIQFFFLVEITTLICAAQAVFFNDIYVVLSILACMFAIAPAYFAAKHFRLELAVSILLCVPFFVFTVMMWSYMGLRDETLILYPGLIMLAAGLGSRRLFISLSVLSVISVMANGYVNYVGIYINEMQPYTIGSALVIAAMLIVTIFCVGAFSNDLQSAFATQARQYADSIDAQKKIEQLINQDALTNLPNRLAAKNQFDLLLAVDGQKSRSLGVLFIDLNGFKQINDALGHEVGDYYLKQISERLNAFVGSEMLLARQGGDEFLVITDQFNNRGDLAVLAQSLLECIELDVDYHGQKLTCSASIGISVAPENGNDFATIVRRADIAMYRAKKYGHAGYAFYAKKMDDEVKAAMVLTTNLRTALSENQFSLCYQPVINIDTNEVVFTEALLRWQHPELGLIYPGQFIATAEQMGVIVALGKWVLEEACAQYQRWLALGLDISISVNISQKQFTDDDFVETLKSVLLRSKVPAEALILEVTESILIEENSHFQQVLAELRKLGVRLALDDFGSGYSNLGYLAEFDFEILKIDKSFLPGPSRDSKQKVILSSIIALAKGLNMKTVVEGIESTEPLQQLTAERDLYGQGFLWSKPVSAEQLFALVDADFTLVPNR